MDDRESSGNKSGR